MMSASGGYMAKKNFYVVKKGKTPGIYCSWEECKQQVQGVPGAVYKGFTTEEEARAYAGEELQIQRIFGGQMTLSFSGEEKLQALPPLAGGEALAYVDGSYNEATGEYSCGVVFFYAGEEQHICQKGEDEEMAMMRNIAGEIMGARLAMEKAIQYGADTLTIVHDYQGIASWCTGEWRTNKKGTKAYKAYFDSLQGQLTIRFQKVKGHSGDAYNDLADSLAKSVIF